MNWGKQKGKIPPSQAFIKHLLIAETAGSMTIADYQQARAQAAQ